MNEDQSQEEQGIAGFRAGQEHQEQLWRRFFASALTVTWHCWTCRTKSFGRHGPVDRSRSRRSRTEVYLSKTVAIFYCDLLCHIHLLYE